MFIRGLVLIACLVATAATAQEIPATAEEPLPSANASSQQQPEAQTPRQESSPDPRGTEKAPLVVKVLAPPRTEAEAAQDAKDREEKAANDRRLADYMEALDRVAAILAIAALLQLLAFGYQAHRMRRTVESFMSGERPHLYPGDFKPSLISGEPSVEFFFINYGKHAAIVRDIRIQLDFVKALPPAPTFTHALRIPGEGVLKGDGAESLRHIVTLGRALTADEAAEVRENKAAFILFGWVMYEDFFGRIHSRGFGFQFTEEDPGYRPFGGEAYNYTRTEKTRAYTPPEWTRDGQSVQR